MRRRAMETAGTPASTFSPAAFQSAQNLRRPPYSQNATLFLSSRRKARKQPERQLQRSPPHRSKPRRTSAAPHTRRTPRFFSLRGEKRENSQNASFNVLPRRVPIHAEPSAAPLYSQNTTLFLSSRRKARKQPEHSTFSPAALQSTQNHLPLPILAERHAFPLFAEKSAKAAGTPTSTFSPLTSNPHRAVRRPPYSQNATLFFSSRRKSAKTAGMPASTFSPAAFQSTQNHPPLPATALSDLP